METVRRARWGREGGRMMWESESGQWLIEKLESKFRSDTGDRL